MNTVHFLGSPQIADWILAAVTRRFSVRNMIGNYLDSSAIELDMFHEK
jgi:disulfide oxidoreductase YuzD